MYEVKFNTILRSRILIYETFIDIYDSSRLEAPSGYAN